MQLTSPYRRLQFNLLFFSFIMMLGTVSSKLIEGYFPLD